MSTSVPAATVSEHREATTSVQKATLYDAPDEARATRARLVKSDPVTVLKQSRPVGLMWTTSIPPEGTCFDRSRPMTLRSNRDVKRRPRLRLDVR